MDDSQPMGMDRAAASLCVLASGSAGNCTVLAVPQAGRRRVCLIDAGLSPRRTKRLLKDLGLAIEDVESILLTHLDSDHFHPGWRRMGVRLRPHRRHADWAAACGCDASRLRPMNGAFELFPGVVVHTVMAAHDAHGTAALRIHFESTGATLGFATDVGRVTDELAEHLAGVDVLAIESNYCPRMQLESNRPGFLKARIMGGAGHLSNEQAYEAVAEARPRRHVLFLHLSRQCNRPDLVERMHRGAEYPFTITDQYEPTGWIPIERGEPRPARARGTVPRRPGAAQLVFGWAARPTAAAGAGILRP